MSKALKYSVIVSLGALLAGCSTFSPYDSDFSCKNDDHGSCEHPQEAYDKALKNDGAAIRDQDKSEEYAEDHKHSNGQGRSDQYLGYKNEVYGELQLLLKQPDTPVLAPAKTVRTLILPYRDPVNKRRLYMSRFVYSVLEEPHFILGEAEKSRVQPSFIESFVNKHSGRQKGEE